MDYPPLKGAALAWVTLSLGLAVFMEVLDTTIANVAVPVIAGNLGAATTQGTWVITSFAVANAVSVPLTGFLAKRIGEVKLFTAAAVGFVITSWLCGIAPNLQALVFFRILQGFIAGPLIPLSQSLLMASSARKTDAGTGIVGNDRRCCPCSRADTRRLDFRKLALGLDFLH